MLLGTLVASLLGNILAGQGIIIAGKGICKSWRRSDSNEIRSRNCKSWLWK